MRLKVRKSVFQRKSIRKFLGESVKAYPALSESGWESFIEDFNSLHENYFSIVDLFNIIKQKGSALPNAARLATDCEAALLDFMTSWNTFVSEATDTLNEDYEKISQAAKSK